MAAPAQPPALETLYASRNVKEGGEKFYVTTAINYTNGNPHIGHAYEGMLADVSARYNRAYGRDVFFLTGTDEHGQKIARSAEGKGMTPKELCDLYAGNFQKLNKRMSICNDYIRTTDRYHEDTARELWKRCSANKNAAGEPDIYLGEYVGWYNEREEQFITEKDAKKTDFKDAYGALLKKVSEKCYFFRLSAYKQRLVDYYTQKPEAIMPAERREEVMKMLEGDLEDLCVSRTTFDWGIRLPEGFEENHVMYVWFDALTNYVSATHLLLPDEQSDPKRRALWPANIHIVGKDITRFHCIYWPAMLWSAGLPLPGSVSGHGFVMDGEGKKMSKSQGNVVDPHDLLDKYPADSVRYYCCNAASYGSDMKCSELGLISDNNTLADQFGNLAQRAVNMVQKEFGEVPGKPEGVVLPAPYDTQPPFDLVKLRESVEECMKVMDVKSALNLIQEATGEANAFINKTEPYKMKDAAQAPARQLCLRLMLESLYALTHFLAPFLPETATRIFNKISPGKAIEDLNGTFDNLHVGRGIAAGPWAEGMNVLFPKLGVAVVVLVEAVRKVMAMFPDDAPAEILVVFEATMPLEKAEAARAPEAVLKVNEVEAAAGKAKNVSGLLVLALGVVQKVADATVSVLLSAETARTKPGAAKQVAALVEAVRKAKAVFPEDTLAEVLVVVEATMALEETETVVKANEVAVAVRKAKWVAGQLEGQLERVEKAANAAASELARVTPPAWSQ